MYNYYEEMEQDIRNYINEATSPEDFADREELEEYLNDTLWNEDSVTGNASGSYTFNSGEAEEYVSENIDLLREAAEGLGIGEEEIGRHFLDEEWEWMDVTIRCYILGGAIADVLDEFEELGMFDEDEEEEEA